MIKRGTGHHSDGLSAVAANVVVGRHEVAHKEVVKVVERSACQRNQQCGKGFLSLADSPATLEITHNSHSLKCSEGGR